MATIEEMHRILDDILERHQEYKMAFSKKHYETIAQVLHKMQPSVSDANGGNDYDVGAARQWESTCLAFLNHFRQDNPAFTADKFLQACRGDKPSKVGK